MSAIDVRVPVAEVKADLERLLVLAVDVMTAEAKLEEAASAFEKKEGWWNMGLSSGSFAALNTPIEIAINGAQGRSGDSNHYGPDKAQDIQDALDVFDFAVERDHLDEEGS